MHAVQLGPDGAKVLGAGRNLDAHEFLDALAVAHGVYLGADAADTLDDLDHLVEVADLHELFQAAVHVAQRGDGLGDDLVLDRQLELERFGQDRVLRAEWKDGASHG